MMKKRYMALLGVAFAGLAAYGGSHLIMSSRQQILSNTVTDVVSPIDSAFLTEDSLVIKGEYIARTADCIACHTAPGGKEFAGGLAMQTPVGAIYSTNITPEADTGIGNYSLSDFVNAVKHGVRKDKSPLYPAMPYPSYTLMPDEDIKALYAYFMKKVTPVRQANPSNTLPFWMSMRWPVAYWQMLFSPQREFIPDSTKDAKINRGAYLVEGPGHCGACHTPRGLAYQEKAFSMQDGDEFLSGAVVDGWRAKSLRGEGNGLGEWTTEELVMFLKTGRTDKTTAFGAMADVIEHSTQYMTDGDLVSMSMYLKSLPPIKNRPVKRVRQEDTTTEKLLAGTDLSRGALLYTEYCMTCHRADGKGVSRIFPSLDDNTAVVANSAQSVIQVTLEGGRMANTKYDRMAFTMPGFEYLGDEDVAELVNYIRTSWTNNATKIDAREVNKVRRFINNKSAHYVGEK
ncbi:Gluconate 2-dehydrogenase cytochrome c subunit [Oligella sp. MSHR50489EDL]